MIHRHHHHHYYHYYYYYYYYHYYYHYCYYVFRCCHTHTLVIGSTAVNHFVRTFPTMGTRAPQLSFTLATGRVSDRGGEGRRRTFGDDRLQQPPLLLLSSLLSLYLRTGHRATYFRYNKNIKLRFIYFRTWIVCIKGVSY